MQVRDIPCGTKGGVLINFEKIEVQLLGNSVAIIDVRFSYSSSLFIRMQLSGCQSPPQRICV